MSKTLPARASLPPLRRRWRSPTTTAPTLLSSRPPPPISASSVQPLTRPTPLRFFPPATHLHPFTTALAAPSSTSALASAEPPDDIVEEDAAKKDRVEDLLANPRDVVRLMKMERRTGNEGGGALRWFPYYDRFTSGGLSLTSRDVLEALDPHIMEGRKQRMKRAVERRSYGVCLVVEGLTDFGNVSAAFRSADALGIQSVHVVSCDSSKRYRDNRHVSMGAEKWLDIELWDSIEECFKILKSRGYRIATTHLGVNSVSVYEMDWSCPTAIVVGNEQKGISDEALQLSDLHCSIPMSGMVDSFNVSVAAGILMHHAVCDRIVRMGCNGDLNPVERQILLAEFSLRHNDSSISIAHEYARRKWNQQMQNCG